MKMVRTKNDFLFRLLTIGVIAFAVLACNTSALIPKFPGDEILKEKGSEMADGGLVMTVQALATQQGSQAVATAAAFATNEGRQFVATSGAFAAEKGQDIISTVEAYATREDVPATAQAAFNDAKEFLSGEAPADIPVPDSSNLNALVKSNGSITFSTSMEYDTILDFYNREMPANGWRKVTRDSIETGLASIVTYMKDQRKATLTITPLRVSNGTGVMIILAQEESVSPTSG